MASEEAVIPLWAADIRESVAEIKATTGQIPGIVTRLENLQAHQVSLDEHARLRATVAELQERDLSARTQWEEITQQVPILWDERAQIKGALRFWRGAVFALTAALTALSLFVLVHQASGSTVKIP